jgi:hypothetical protein
MTPSQIKELLARFPWKELETGNLRTCPARLSYPSLFEKSKPRGNITEQKYSATLLFPLTASMALLEEAIGHTAIEEFGSKWKSASLRLPIRDQGEKEGKAGYTKGAKFITCKSDQRPGIVGADGRPMTDPSLIYAGCWVIATIRPFAYTSPSKGISTGLQNIVKIADDEPFGGAPADPNEEFADILDSSASGESLFGEDDAKSSIAGAFS